MKFRDHKYEWRNNWGTIHHQWSFRGPKGGISFSASLSPEGKWGPSCGLEFHHAFDPSNGQEAPHHSNCWLIGGHCWHDGTSLYASETLWPIIESMGSDHRSIFNLLEGEYCRRFGKENDDEI